MLGTDRKRPGVGLPRKYVVDDSPRVAQQSSRSGRETE
jgi:hypothetical protein